ALLEIVDRSFLRGRHARARTEQRKDVGGARPFFPAFSPAGALDEQEGSADVEPQKPGIRCWTISYPLEQVEQSTGEPLTAGQEVRVEFTLSSQRAAVLCEVRLFGSLTLAGSVRCSGKLLAGDTALAQAENRGRLLAFELARDDLTGLILELVYQK